MLELRRRVEKVKEVLAKDATNRVLLFCQLPPLMAAVRDALEEKNIATAELKGSPHQMHETMQRFKAAEGRCSEARVLLLSLDEHCAGANLTAANHVMFAHPLLRHDGRSPADIEVQAVGRVRRFGQNRTVHVWHFMIQNTIEEQLELDNQLERRV